MHSNNKARNAKRRFRQGRLSFQKLKSLLNKYNKVSVDTVSPPEENEKKNENQ